MITVNGQPVHPAVALAFFRLAAAFKKATGWDLFISSGYRSYDQQAVIFLSRYRRQASGGGPYGDIRWWAGVRYVRYSPAGTVAVPGTSLHESFRAIDVRDGGPDAGVMTAGTVRANWLRANAPAFGFNPRGYNFGEPWHLEYTGSMTVPAGAVVVPVEIKEEEDVIDMSTTKYLFTRDAGDGKPAYGLFGEQVPGGSRISRSLTTAEVWGAMFGKEGESDFGAPWKELTNAQWNRAINEARVINAAWLAQFPEKSGPVDGFEFDYAKFAEALAAVIPTVDPVAIAKAVNDDAAGRLAD